MTVQSSQEYSHLCTRITAIKACFDFEQALDGITAEQEDKLRGLRLLCHAELEDYFESMSMVLLENAINLWRTHRIANYNLASLFIDHDKFTELKGIDTRIGKIIADYRDTVNSNNGIKEPDIKKIFCPLGYDINDFDTSFIATVSSFGSLRGETAHTSAAKAQQQLDKHTEYTRINDILSGIANFENVLMSKYPYTP